MSTTDPNTAERFEDKSKHELRTPHGFAAEQSERTLFKIYTGF